MELYQSKTTDYFSNIRFDLISFLKPGINRLLEIGAGSGDTLVEIKRRKLAKEVVGVELMRLPGTNQGSELIDRFIFGDLESLENTPNDFYDVIVCGDILEHLVDPWKMVDRLRAMLTPMGSIIISTPNARYYEMFIKVFIKGSFAYTDFGLFDKTHLRFFCKRDLKQMILSSGFEIESATPSFRFHPKSKPYLINKFTLGIFEEFLTLQYIVCARLK